MRVFSHTGVWEENGNERISSFFTDYGVERKKRNEFRINWDFPPISSHNHEEYPGLISLYNLNVIPDKVGTNRVIRIYDKIGSKVKLIERIDFIDNSSLSEKNDDINNLTIKILKEIKEKTTNDKTPIEHIIIKDLDHGVVTKDLIEKLIYEFPPDKVNFYISSKRWLPDWLECFNDKNVKLLIIPQMSSQIALRDKKFDTWMTKLGFITYDGLNLMEFKDDSDCFGSIKINKLIILPEKERVIAYDSELNDRGNNLYIQTESQDNYSEIELPMASMFFPEVIKILISEPKIEFGQVVGRALIETVKWRKSLFEYINENKPRFVLKTKNSNLDDQSKKFRNKINFGKWKEVNFAKAQKNWELSLSNLGLRDLGEAYSLEFSNCNNRIELWRAKTIIDGYVCISANRKAKIRKLFYSLLRNESTKLKRSEVSFIKASPGSGKSHLVNSLANALGLTLVSFNLSQIQSIDQLIDCFDEINTSQAENKDQKPIIVFFDEINTKIEGVYPYSYFLAPLEDGYYLRNNHRMQLKPCIWIFVGTTFKTGKKDKASDFKSRFTLPIIDLKTPINDNISSLKLLVDDEIPILKLENIYYCVSFIRNIFKQVTKVSLEVLKVFSLIKPYASVRDIRKFIESIQHIPYEEIRIKQIKQVIDSYKKSDEERYENLFLNENQDEIQELLKVGDQANNLVRIFDNPSSWQLESNYIIEVPDEL